MVDLGRPEIARIDLDVALPVEVELAERDLDELAHRVRLAGGDDVVVGAVLLQHGPHRLDVVTREAPVAPRLQVAEVELAVEVVADARSRARDLARDE